MKREKVNNQKEHEGSYFRSLEKNPLIEYVVEKKGNKGTLFSQSVKVIFVLSGTLCVTLGRQGTPRLIKKGNFFLLPQQEQFTFIAEEDSEVVKILLSAPGCNFYDYLPFDFFNQVKEEKTLYFHKYLEGGMTIMTINKSIKDYLTSVLNAYTDGLRSFDYQEVKQKELFFLLMTYYSKEKLTAFFYPILTNDVFFAKIIFDNVNQLKTVGDVARLTKYSESGVKKRFAKVFNMPISHWIDQQKAKKIYFEICNKSRPFKELATEYGFYSGAHFNHFCYRMFGCSPSSLKRKIYRKYEEQAATAAEKE